MRPASLVPVIACAVLYGSNVAAAPLGHARWHGGISCESGPLDVSVLPGAFVSMTAHVERPSGPNFGYELELVVRDAAGSTLADAWRFEEGGCQSGRAYLEDVYVVDPINRCPYFGDFGPRQVTHIVEFDPSASVLRIRLRAAWASPWTPDSTRAYRTGRVFFDHEFSAAGTAGPGECGKLASPVCIAVSLSWLDAAGELHPWAMATPFLTANGAGIACDAVPAPTTTWGAIKAQYR